jgi:hypothetical protein
VGPPTLTHHEFGPSLSNGVGQRAELTDECGKVLILEEEVEKVRVECDRLWCELQAEAKVSEAGRITLAERSQELDTVRVRLQGLIADTQEACDALLPPPAWEAFSTSPSRCVHLRCAFPGLLGAQSAKGLRRP